MVGFKIDAPSNAGTILVAVHSANPPSPQEWQEWAAICEQALKASGGDLATSSNLVVTDGGAPDAEQRTRITRVLADAYTQPRVAVVTESSLVRLAVRAFAMFNRDTRAFAPSQFAEAVDHVRWPRFAIPQLLDAIEEHANAAFGRNSLACLRAIRAAHPER